MALLVLAAGIVLVLQFELVSCFFVGLLLTSGPIQLQTDLLLQRHIRDLLCGEHLLHLVGVLLDLPSDASDEGGLLMQLIHTQLIVLKFGLVGGAEEGLRVEDGRSYRTLLYFLFLQPLTFLLEILSDVELLGEVD